MLLALIPRFRHAAFAVWRRNTLVWRKLLGPSLIINFGEPFLYLLGLGYGLGLFIGDMMHMPYLTFLASGILASSAMNIASFEAMFSVYTRMIPQRTYDAILATPVEVRAILTVAVLLGAVQSWTALWVLPIQFVVGLCFAGPALIMTALARGYDFFNYYVTLLITPMFVLSGVFYPVSSLPPVLQGMVQFLPLTHAVDLIRPLVAGQPVTNVALHLGVLLAYGLAGYLVAVKLVRRRLLV
jgi:lipooligosaccharide transport system permease protein